MTDSTERRSPVLRISIPWMLDTLGTIDRLVKFHPDLTYGEVFADLLDGANVLETLFGQSVYSPYLRASRDKGNVLFGEVTSLMDNTKHPWGDPIQTAALRIKTAAEHFRLVFLSEISTLPVFLVQPKDNYDVALLIDRGSGLFPPALTKKVPETAFDAGEVGKALAFQLPTACGFHTFRVLESVLKRYWDVSTGGDPRPEPATIGKMAADLENKKKGDVKVTESLKQFAKLHRNPTTHSDVALSDEEAIGTLGIARSIIAAMLKALPDAPLPTTVASSAGPPP